MGVKNTNYILILCICLHATLESTTATISPADVRSCIDDVRKSLDGQKTTAKIRFEELRIRKTNDMKEQRKERYDSLVASIQNEKNVLSKLKQSAIQDNFNVTMCNDTSNIYDLISTSFQSSSDATLAEYKNVVDRNHTQNSMLVDKYALKYQQLEKDLTACEQQPQNLECFDKVEDNCEIFGYQNEIFDLQSSYYADAEKTFVVFKLKLGSLYEQKLKEVKSFSSEMKSCYTSVKNVNSTTDLGGSGVSYKPFLLLVLLPILYTVLIC